MHTWKFFRTCGLDQVAIRNGEDIAHLSELDQKLWTALSCPTKGVRLDAATLDLLDTDKDGRVRVPEVLAAIEWLSERLVSLDPLIGGTESLRLSAINASSSAGQALLANAKRVLANLGKKTEEIITLSDVADVAKRFSETRFNGDGIVPADAAEDDATRRVIEDIIATMGAETDLGGKPGVNQAKLDAFFSAARAYLAWMEKTDASVLPLEEATESAYGVFMAVREKVDDYFARCRLAAYDGRAEGPLNRSEADYAALSSQTISDAAPALASFPLSHVAAGRDLSLMDGVNPYWESAIRRFKDLVVVPLQGADGESLSETQWEKLKATFGPYEAWIAARAGAEVASLGIGRLKELCAGEAFARVSELIAMDGALAVEGTRLAEVEKLLRLNAHLATLLNNFVNMSRLYDPNACAIFRVGTLYMDARACSLCFHVDDLASHSAQAAASKCCLAYCSLARAGSKETRLICAAFTAGFSQTLWIGRNGVFYDRDGKDWDATIVKMIDNSMSLKEAFWDPWRKVAAMIGSQVRKVLGAKQEAALQGVSKKVEATVVLPSAQEPPKKVEGAALASSAAALGIAVGLISTAIGGVVSAVAGLPMWKTALGLVAVLLVVSGPAMILTWFKLRSRDLAPLLNACGWAVNRSLRLSIKLARLFTAEAVLPPGAERQLSDPYADDHTLRDRLIVWGFLVFLVAGLWMAGFLRIT